MSTKSWVSQAAPRLGEPSLTPQPTSAERWRGSALGLGASLLLVLLGCTNAGGPAPSTNEPVVAPVAAPTTVQPHSEWAEAILYFVIVDRFADGDATSNVAVNREAPGAFHGGDLIGLTESLDELADLGVTALWITPVVKNIDGFVTGAGFPDWGYHGYWADDFYSLDPRFGSEEDLKALIDAAHQRGIKVLLDIVYNHAGYDSQYLTDPATRGWLRAEDRGTCGDDDIIGCLSGLPDFKTENGEVADYLMKAHLDLAARVGLDGFRLDTVKHVTHEFWQEHRRRARAQMGDDFFLIGEVWGGDARSLDPWFENDEMDAGFDFGFQGSTLGFLQGRGRAVAFNRYLEKRHEVRDGYLLSHYLSSHDVPGALFQLQGDVEIFRLAAILQFTTAGMPTIYYGEEVARAGGDWPDNRSDMPWGNRDIEPGAGDPRDEDLRRLYRRLIAIRRAHPALWRGSHAGVAFDDHLLVFARQDEASDDFVVVAVNRGTEATVARFDRPAAWTGSQIRDILGEEIFEFAGEAVEIPLAAKSARILVR